MAINGYANAAADQAARISLRLSEQQPPAHPPADEQANGPTTIPMPKRAGGGVFTENFPATSFALGFAGSYPGVAPAVNPIAAVGLVATGLIAAPLIFDAGILVGQGLATAGFALYDWATGHPQQGTLPLGFDVGTPNGPLFTVPEQQPVKKERTEAPPDQAPEIDEPPIETENPLPLAPTASDDDKTPPPTKTDGPQKPAESQPAEPASDQAVQDAIDAMRQLGRETEAGERSTESFVSGLDAVMAPFSPADKKRVIDKLAEGISDEQRRSTPQPGPAPGVAPPSRTLDERIESAMDEMDAMPTDLDPDEFNRRMDAIYDRFGPDEIATVMQRAMERVGSPR